MSHRQHCTAQQLIARAGALVFTTLASASIAVFAQNSGSTSANDPLQELKIEGSVVGANATGSMMCSPTALGRFHGDLGAAMNEQTASINAQMQTKDYLGVLGNSRLAAQGFSYCYTKYGKESDAPLYAATVGRFLTAEAVAGRAAGITTPEVLSAPARARTLLTYAKGAGQDTSAELAALDKLDPPHQATNSVGAPIPLTAEAAVTAYKGNQLRFESQYDNHILQITGPARTVRDVGNGVVWIGIVGHKPERIHADSVICEINNDAQKAKAAALNVPGPVTVAGTFHAARGQFAVEDGIKLHDCQVVEIPTTTRNNP